MQNLLLTLAAAAIGALVLFSVAAVNWRTTHASDSAAQYAAAKTSLQSFVEILEQDLSNLGAGLTNNTIRGKVTSSYTGPFTSTTPWDTTSTNRYLEFCSIEDPAAVATASIDPTTNTCDVIRYQWRQTGTASVRNEGTSAHDYQTVPVYTLDRFVNGAADGGSLDVLTRIGFTFLDAAGAKVTGTTATDLRSIRAVRVSVKAVSPLGGGSGYTSSEDAALAYDMDQTRWTRTIRPPNLARVIASN